MTTPQGYEQLHDVLMAAIEQASAGKGQERHANGLPFHDQRMQRISTLLDSPSGMAFQVIKKMTEGLQFACPERREAELLGAINYLAGIVVWYRNMPTRNAAKAGWTPEAIDAAAFKPEWPSEERIDVVAQNGNDGLHYQPDMLEIPDGIVIPDWVEWIVTGGRAIGADRAPDQRDKTSCTFSDQAKVRPLWSIPRPIGVIPTGKHYKRTPNGFELVLD